MIHCAIVNQSTGKVVNAVEYETVPMGDVPGFPPGHIAIEHDRATPGWAHDGSNFIEPPQQELPPPTRERRIATIEAKYPVTQRALREAVLLIGERFPEIKSTPIYDRAFQAEAAISPLRT